MDSRNRREGRRILLARSERKIPHWLKGKESPHRLISFFELLGAYVGIRLWAPSRLGNQDLTWLAIPIGADNLGGRFHLKETLYSGKTDVLDVTRIGSP